jgi:hypothetical protein
MALLAWKDYLQQLSSDSSKRFDAVWLGFLAATSDLFLLLLDTGNQGLSGIVLAEGKSYIYNLLYRRTATGRDSTTSFFWCKVTKASVLQKMPAILVDTSCTQDMTVAEL